MAVKKEPAATPKPAPEAYIQTLIDRANEAQQSFMDMTQEQVDEVVQAMALAGLDQHMRLARMAVDETGRGVYEDKITKNMFSTEYIYHSIKYEKR